MNRQLRLNDKEAKMAMKFKTSMDRSQSVQQMFYLDKCEFAEAGTALCVSDGDLSVVFDPPSSTEDVVYTRGDLVPFVLISKPKSTG